MTGERDGSKGDYSLGLSIAGGALAHLWGDDL